MPVLEILLMFRVSACVCACVRPRGSLRKKDTTGILSDSLPIPGEDTPSHCLTRKDRIGHFCRYNTSRSLADCTSLHALPVRALSLGCGLDIPVRIDRVSADPEVQGCRVLVPPSIDGRPGERNLSSHRVVPRIRLRVMSSNV